MQVPASPTPERARRAARTVAALATALLAALSPACENPDPHIFPDPLDPGGDGTISLARDVQPLFTLHCAGCHGGASPEAQLTLESGRLYDPTLGAVGVASWEQPSLLRIEPGASDRSYLVRKLTGEGIVGERMPLGGALSDGEIEIIRKWIDDGARDN